MIRDSSSMDRPVGKPRFGGRRGITTAAIVAAVLVSVAVLGPSVRRWLRSEVSVDSTRIRIGAVTRGDLVREVAVQGNVVAAFNPTLFSPAQGIARLMVRAGQEIAPGDVLARVESPRLESRLEQERSNLSAMQADFERQLILARQSQIEGEQDIGLMEVELEAADRALNRAERSRSEGILNDVEYESSKDNVRIATMKLELAKRRKELDQESLELETQNRRSQVNRQRLVVDELYRQVAELVITSPVAGVVSRLAIADQDAVIQGSPVVGVVDLSAFELEIAVPELYADEIDPTTRAEITYDDRTYEGRVKSLSPEVTGSRVEGRVTFVDDPPAGLKQNQRLSLKLVLETVPDVLKAPRGPFLEAGGGGQAYLIEDGVATLVPIESGAQSVTEVEIRSGLEVGDRIIVSDTTKFEGAQSILVRN